MKSLDELMSSVAAMDQDSPPSPQDLDMLFYSPCPVKLAVKERIEAIAAASEASGDPLAVHIPMGCTSVDPYDPLYKETDPEKLPGIIASIGFGDFFRTGFRERFVDAGVFQAVLPEEIHPMLERAGLPDPQGRYVVYGLTPYIFLADLDRLGATPPPERWEDLLDGRYKGQINMCGDGDDMADAVLINYYKEYGMDGVERFAANAKSLLHSSRMGKSGGARDAGGLYILPYFFAESSRQPGHMRVLCPQDGASASPLYFLSKPGARPRIDPLLDFFNKDFGRIPSARWFLPLSGPLPDTLPEDATVIWPGWDYIRSIDVTAARDMLNETFRRLLRERNAPCGS